MRKLVAILILFALCLTARAQQSFITASLTITNAPTNVMTFAINGYTWTFTNNVTSANSQIATTNSGNATATNVWVALISFPSAIPSISVQMTNTNALFLQTFPAASPALTITTNGLTGSPSWATWTYTTNTLTNEVVVRVPTNGLGLLEISNVGNWLVQYLNSPYDTNAVNSALPQWSNFVGFSALANLSNFTLNMGTNLTNYVRTFGTNSTNFTLAVGTNSTNYSSNLVANLGTYITNTWSNVFQTYLNTLYEPTGPGLSYLDGGGNIVLTNGPGGGGGGQTRMYAQKGGNFVFTSEDNQQFFYEITYGAGGQLDVNIGDGARKRVWVVAPTDGAFTQGSTLLQSATGSSPGSALLWDLSIQYLSQTVDTAMPITETEALWPATIIGATTNFYDQEANPNSSTTSIDDVVVPANALTNNGDTIIREATLSLASGAGTREVQVVFGGLSAFVDTGALTMTGSGFCKVAVTITRKSGSALIYSGSATITGTATPTTLLFGASASGFNSGGNWGSISDFHLAVTSASGSAGDITVLTDTVKFSPSPIYGTFQ